MNLEDREYIDYLLRRGIVRNLYKPIILTEQQIDEKLEDGNWHVEYFQLEGNNGTLYTGNGI